MKLVNVYVTKKNNNFVANDYVAENEVDLYKEMIAKDLGVELNFLFRPNMDEEVELVEKGNSMKAFVDGKVKIIYFKKA